MSDQAFERHFELGEELMGMLDAINTRFDAQNRMILAMTIAIAALAGSLLLTQIKLRNLTAGG